MLSDELWESNYFERVERAWRERHGWDTCSCHRDALNPYCLKHGWLGFVN